MTHEQLSSQSGGETKIERKRLHSHPHAQTSSILLRWWKRDVPGSEPWSASCKLMSCERKDGQSLEVIRELSSLSIQLIDKNGRQGELREAALEHWAPFICRRMTHLPLLSNFQKSSSKSPKLNAFYILENVTLKGKLPRLLDGHNSECFTLRRKNNIVLNRFLWFFYVHPKRVVSHASIAGYILKLV